MYSRGGAHTHTLFPRDTFVKYIQFQFLKVKPLSHLHNEPYQVTIHNLHTPLSSHQIPQTNDSLSPRKAPTTEN